VLLALAESGPKAVISYDDLRELLGDILSAQVPQKHEITSALKHLSRISQKIGAGSAVDWDDDNREITVVDPYLRFYLRWQVRREKPPVETGTEASLFRNDQGDPPSSA